MKARFYIRVSTDEQAAEGFSLSAQEDRCRQFIQSQGWQEDGFYCDDGYSAKDLRRPGMQELIRDVENRLFDVLVIYRLDRLVRSVLDLHYLLKLFDRHDVKFKSVTEVFDTTTATGRLFISIIGSLAQWERENLSERVKVGMEKRALEGKRNGAQAPYGYNLIDGKLVPNPEEAKIVKRIFEMYRYHGQSKICRILNEEGIRTQSGALWSQYTIRYILNNPVYVGKLRYRYRFEDGKKQPSDAVMINESDHEPLISMKLWEEVKKKQEQRTKGPAKAFTTDYPFTGILFCARCGRSMVGYKKPMKNSDSYYYYYRCQSKSSNGTCEMPSVSEMALEDALFSRIEWMAENIEVDPDRVLPVESNRSREDIEKELNNIKRRKRKWQIAYAEDIISLEELRDRTAEDHQREKELLEELEKINDDNPKDPKWDKEQLLEGLRQLKYLWKHAERRERKEMLHLIFCRLLVDVESTKHPGRHYRPVRIIEYDFS